MSMSVDASRSPIISAAVLSALSWIAALICVSTVKSVVAMPMLSTAAYSDQFGYFTDQASFLARPDVRQVDFRFISGEPWDTSDIFSTRFWSENKRNFGGVSTLDFEDGVSLTGVIQLQGIGHVGETLPYRTDMKWLPAAPLPGVAPELQLLSLSFENSIQQLSLLLEDFGDTASFNSNQAVNGPTLIDLHFEALLDGVSVFSQAAFNAIADYNRQFRALSFDAGTARFNEVRLTYGGVFPHDDLGDVSLFQSIAFAPVAVSEAPSLVLLVTGLGLLAARCRLRRRAD